MFFVVVSVYCTASFFLSCRIRFNLLTRQLAFVGFCFSLAAVVMIGLGHRLIEKQLPHELEKITLTVSGVVAGIPKVDRNKFVKTTFDFEVLSGADGENNSCESKNNPALHGKVRLSWSNQYARESQKRSLTPIFMALSPGQALCLTVRLRRPRGNSNPGGFDFQRWLLSNGYIATGYVTDLMSAPGQRNPSIIEETRWNIYGFFQSQVSDPELIGSFLALSLGEKFAITDAQWQLLRSTGTLHLLVISGLHVGIVAALGFLVGYFLAKIIGWRTGVHPVWVAPVVSIVVVGGYVALAGFSLPTQRAFIMVLIANLLLATGRINQAWLGYWVSMIVCLLMDPLAAHGAGFWLSFGVVAVILSGIRRYNSTAPVVGFFFLQVRIFVCMALPLGLLTSGISLSGLIVNLIAIPYISFVVVPLVLVTSSVGLLWANSFLSISLVELSSIVIDGFWFGLRMFEKCTGFIRGSDEYRMFTGFLDIPTLQISGSHWLLAFFSVALLLMPLITGWQRVLLVTSILLVLFGSNNSAHTARLIVFDVGQGLSSLVQAETKTLVYDTGPSLGDDHSQSEQVLIPFLMKSNIHTIDRLMLSHGDSDHASGLLALSEQFLLKSVVSGEPGRLSIKSNPCERGQSWQWESETTNANVQFDVLWPLKMDSEQASNDKSCVLLIKIGKLRILHTGDISKSVEWALVRLGLPDVDVLIAPHHGSHSSSSLRFLLATQPEHIIFSTGYLNRYHHPSNRVVARIKKHLPESTVWNTATDGAIHVVIDRKFDWQIYTSRKINRRYWHSLE